MKQIDIIKTYANKRCLVVDDVPDVRASLKRILVDYGCNEVDTAGNAEEAIDLCHRAQYDIVLADHNLGAAKNGQQLLEELRFNKLLKNTSIFIMITAESAGYRVLHALENQPDEYLNKPINKESLRPRLDIALLRNEALFKAKEAIDNKKLNTSIACCQDVVEEGGKFSNDARKLLGKLQCKQKRFEDAKATYQQIPAERYPHWASLGTAEAAFGLNDLDFAEQTLKKLISEHPLYVDAHDLLAKILESQHKLPQAQMALENAVKISPMSSPRQRDLGRIADTVGDLNAAVHAYRAAVKHSKNSCHEEAENYINLADALARYAQNKPDDEIESLADEALEQVNQLNKKYSKHPVVKVRSKLVEADVHLLFGKEDSASIAIREACETQSNIKVTTIANTSTSLCIGCAKAFIAHGKYDEGEALLQKISKANQDKKLNIEIDKLLREPVTKEGIQYAAKLNKQGIEQYRKGEVDSSIRSFQAVLKELPNHVGLNLNLIQALVSKHKESGISDKENQLIESSFQRVGKLKDGSSYIDRYIYLEKRINKILEDK